MSIDDHALTLEQMAYEMAVQLDEIGIKPASGSYQKWLNFKAMEKYATEKRREIEDRLIAEFAISDTEEGTKSVEDRGYKVKVTMRMNRKVDADKLQELAAEHGLTDHLGDLFRWKPEINMKLWQAADQSITEPLLGAITTKPGRPSFAIEATED